MNTLKLSQIDQKKTIKFNQIKTKIESNKIFKKIVYNLI